MSTVSLTELWSRATRNPLAVAFAVSVVLHTGLFEAWQNYGPRLFASGRGFLSGVLARLTISERGQKNLIDKLKQIKNQELFEQMLKRQQEIPLSFMEVDPALATPEPPKTAKNYSTHNTVASNPDLKKNADLPKIDGKDKKVPRLFDNAKPQPKATPQPLQPTLISALPEPPLPAAATPAKADQPPQVRPDAKPDAKSEPARPLQNVADRTFDKTADKTDFKMPGGQTIGDLAMGKPQSRDFPNKIPGKGAPASANPLIVDPSPPARRERPRTLAQAYAQNPMLAGQRMQQDGGVPRLGRISVDAKGSTFGVYDAAFIAAVEERWYQLIDSYRDKGGVLRQGKVTLEFRLRFDGRITEMKTILSSTGDVQSLMCERAVLDPAPYARWPAEMRQQIQAEFREVRFTFYYE